MTDIATDRASTPDATPDQTSDATSRSPWRDLVSAAEIDTRLFGMLLALIVIWVAFHVLSGGDFLTARNLWNLSVQSASIAIMATGMVLIIVSRNIDLSVGSLLGFLGYTMALVQTNFKRLLAYSTISHVGFLLLGLLSADAPGYAASMFYAISYSIMAVAAFGSIILLSRSGFEACDIEDFRGLWVKSPGYAFLVLFVIASLAGIPPFLGFFAKLQVIVAALQGGYQWLAILAVVSAVIGAFYYLKLIRVMFFEKPDSDAVQVNADNHLRAAFAVNAAALLVLGVFSNGILAWCIRAFPA